MMLEHAGASTATKEFRNGLLRQTFDWCRSNSSFYSDRFAEIRRFDGLDDLHKLPVLKRDDVLHHHADIVCDPDTPACVQYTTGTTGTFLPLYRSQREIDFIRNFYTRNLREKLQNPSQLRPLQLSLTSAYHGSPTPIPSPAYILTAGVYDRTQAQQATNLLTRSFSFPGVEERVSAILGGDLLIKALTAYMIAEGVDPASIGIKSIVFTGGYTSERTKRLLAKLWAASVIDRYSMSEIFGGAVQAIPGTPFMFDVEVVPEVINPHTLTPVQEGCGVLLLTSLYPFSQMMPMVRYYTGDLVEIVSGSQHEANFAVRFVGRERRSIIESGDEGVVPLVLSAKLHDVLETLPDVSASPRFTGLASDTAMEFAGKLHYAVDAERDQSGRVRCIAIKVGLRYAPWLFPEHALSLVTRIRTALYENLPVLRERVLDGSLDLDIELTTGDKLEPFTMK